MTGPLSFPLRVDATGRTASAGEDRHIRDLIELVLMTEPGERVMRPDFGCGLRALVFTMVDEVVAAATQSLVHAQLRRWLGDVASIDAVTAQAYDDGRLVVTVAYHRRTTGTARTHVVAVTA